MPAAEKAFTTSSPAISKQSSLSGANLAYLARRAGRAFLVGYTEYAGAIRANLPAFTKVERSLLWTELKFIRTDTALKRCNNVVSQDLDRPTLWVLVMTGRRSRSSTNAVSCLFTRACFSDRKSLYRPPHGTASLPFYNDLAPII
jgi:hypothetical protein